MELEADPGAGVGLGNLPPTEGDEAHGSHGKKDIQTAVPYLPGPMALSPKPAALTASHPDPSQLPCFTPAVVPWGPPHLLFQRQE